MTVLAWLLLCLAVTQFGRCGERPTEGSSISPDEGASPHSSPSSSIYSNHSTSRDFYLFSTDDGSQTPSRRARRSVDSELEDRQREFNATETDLERYRAELTAAQDAARDAKKAWEDADRISKDEKIIAGLKDGARTTAVTDLSGKTAETGKALKAASDARDAHKDEDDEMTIKILSRTAATNKHYTKNEELKIEKEKVEKEEEKYTTLDGNVTLWKDQDAKLTELDKEKAGNVTVRDECIQKETNKEDLNKKERNIVSLETARTTAESSKNKTEIIKNNVMDNEILNGKLTDPSLNDRSLKDQADLWSHKTKQATSKKDKEHAEAMSKFLNQLKTLPQAEKKFNEINIPQWKTDVTNDFNTADTNFKKADKAVTDNTKDISKLKESIKDVNWAELKKKKNEADANVKALEGKISEAEREKKRIAGLIDISGELAVWEPEVQRRRGEAARLRSALTASGLEAEVTRLDGDITTKTDIENAYKIVVERGKNEKMDKAKLLVAALLEEEEADGVLSSAEATYQAQKQKSDDLEALVLPLQTKHGAAESALWAKEREAGKYYQANLDAKEKLNNAIEAKAAEQKRDREHESMLKLLQLGISITAGLLVLVVIGGVVAFLLVRRRRKKAAIEKKPSRIEFKQENGLTCIRREGEPDQSVIKAEDFKIMGPLVRGHVSNKIDGKHLLDDQTDGDKLPGPIFFDKDMNEAYFIGEGVEIMQPDSVSISEGRGELFAGINFDDDLVTSKKGKKDKEPEKDEAKAKDAKGNAPSSSEDKKSSDEKKPDEKKPDEKKKSSKSKRSNDAKAKNAPNSPNAAEKKAEQQLKK